MSSKLVNPLTNETVNAALDEEWTIDTSFTIADLFGGTVSLGTGGDSQLEYHRIGRTVVIDIYFKIGSGATFGNGGPWYIPVAQLPWTPKNAPVHTVSPQTNYTKTGGFGFFSSTTNAMTEVVAPVMPRTGVGSTLAFVCPPGDGGLGNLFLNGTPMPIVEGDVYQGHFMYQAASAL